MNKERLNINFIYIERKNFEKKNGENYFIVDLIYLDFLKNLIKQHRSFSFIKFNNNHHFITTLNRDHPTLNRSIESGKSSRISTTTHSYNTFPPIALENKPSHSSDITFSSRPATIVTESASKVKLVHRSVRRPVTGLTVYVPAMTSSSGKVSRCTSTRERVHSSRERRKWSSAYV